MGYCIYQLEARFRLRECNAGPALAAIKEMAWEEYQTGLRLVRQPRFQDEVMEWMEQAKHLDDALRCLGWLLLREGDLETVTEEPAGDVIEIELCCDTLLRDQDVVFATLAPFVEDDSYVTVAGEDDRMWRWLFRGGKCYRQAASLRFDGELEGPMPTAPELDQRITQRYQDLERRMQLVRDRAIKLGIATPENVDKAIKSLSLEVYRHHFGHMGVKQALFPEC